MEFAGLLPKQRFAVVGAAKAGHCELGKVSMTPLLEARLGRGCEVGGGTSGIPNYRSAGFCAICNGGSKLFASASHGISGTSCGSATESHRSEEHTSELQSLMRISYAVFCLQKINK